MSGTEAVLGWHAWATVVVVVFMVYLLVRDTVAPAMAVFGATVALLIIGVIDVPAAFAGFANPAPMTVAALFVVARAVEKTGALQPFINATLGNGGSSQRVLGRLLVPTAGASAVLNNTPIVAMLAPQVTEWAARKGVSPSRYLMPISFATILGGTITVIGTSTNLVVSGLLEQSGYAPIGMFEITRIGLPVAIVGVLFLALFSHVLLPERRTARRHFQEEFREFVVQMVVVPGGPLDGATVEQGSLRHLQGVFLAEVRRREETIAPARPDTVLLGGDRLTFVGRVDVVRDLQMMRGLVGAEREHTTGLEDETHTFFEVVVSGASSLAGKTLRDTDFRNRFQAAVVAIHRAGERVNEKLGAVRLREGDTLLLLSDRGFANRWRDGNEFLLVAHLGGSPPVSTRQAITVGIITAAIVTIAGAGILPMVHTALLGALLIVALGVLTPAEARARVPLVVENRRFLCFSHNSHAC
jgi:di/tricarboxylate transporter